MDSSSEDKEYVLETNALLIDTIIRRLMNYFTPKGVKNCRLVCHKWNYYAERVLKRRANVVLTTPLQASQFVMAQFSQPQLLAKPFTSVSLQIGYSWLQKMEFIKNGNYDYDKPEKQWTIAEINAFFKKWGKYIKKLQLILYKVQDSFLLVLNMDPILLSMGSNLEDIVLIGNSGLRSEISLKLLSYVKNISLDTCYVKLESLEKRLTPSKFKFVNVLFLRDGKTVPIIIINDFVDFSRCSDINLKKESSYCTEDSTAITFDFSRDFVNCKQIKFGHMITPLNVTTSKTKTNRLSICSSPTESVQIHLKELELKNCKIDLTLISTKVERLTIMHCDVVSLDIPPLDFPNLKYFSFTPCYERIFDSNVYKIVSVFVNCEDLSDLELTRSVYSDVKVESELNVDYLPKSVKVLKFRQNHGLKFVGSNDKMEVDILVFLNEDRGKGDAHEERLRLSLKKVLERVKPKVLIRAVFRRESFFRDEPKETVSQFVANIVQDKKLEKTIVELKLGPYILKVLESVDQSKSCKDSVDKDSSVYHEFLGQFLVTEEQSKHFDGYLPR